MRLLESCLALEDLSLPFVGQTKTKSSTDTWQYPFGYLFSIALVDATKQTRVSQTFYKNSLNTPAESIYYLPKSLKQVTITGGNILYGAFDNCSMLTDIDVSETDARAINTNAFRNCTGLSNIHLPKNLEEVKEDAFAVPESFYLPVENIYINKSIEDWVGINFIDSPQARTNIAAEQGCHLYLNGSVSELTTVNIQTAPKISSKSFYNMKAITAITISPKVSEIANDAFYGDKNITSLELPYFPGELSWELFIGQTPTSLATLKFTNWTDLDIDFKTHNIFSGLLNLEELVLPNNLSVLDAELFKDCNSNIYKDNFYIPAGYYDEETETSSAVDHQYFIKNNGSNRVVINAQCSVIADHAFENSYQLTNVTIPDSVKYIGEQAFANCVSLKNICISSNIESIGVRAFSNCSNLRSISVSKDNNNYSSGDFYTNAILTKDEDNLQFGCGNTKINRNNITTIGEYAFDSCNSLTSIELPTEITTLSEHCFNNCKKLSEIYYKGTEVAWEAITKATTWKEGCGNIQIHYVNAIS